MSVIANPLAVLAEEIEPEEDDKFRDPPQYPPQDPLQDHPQDPLQDHPQDPLQDPLYRDPPQDEPRRGSVFKLFEDPYCGEAPRSSVFKARSSIFQLFDDPYCGEDPRKLSLALEELRKGSSDKVKPKHVQFTRQQTLQLRKHILYNGEYRVLNMALVSILAIILFGILFMSVWHSTNQNFWVLYLVLFLLIGAIGAVLLLVKAYFIYKRDYARSRRPSVLFCHKVFKDGSVDNIMDSFAKRGDAVDNSVDYVEMGNVANAVGEGDVKIVIDPVK